MSLSLFRCALLFSVASVTLFAEVSEDASLKESTLKLQIYDNSAQPGEIYSGKLVKVGGRELYLDITPCIADLRKKQIKAFTKPYKTRRSDDIKCGDAKVTGIIVVQQLK